MLKDLFNKKKEVNEDSATLIPALLIQAAKIDEKYTDVDK